MCQVLEMGVTWKLTGERTDEMFAEGVFMIGGKESIQGNVFGCFYFHIVGVGLVGAVQEGKFLGFGKTRVERPQ